MRIGPFWSDARQRASAGVSGGSNPQTSLLVLRHPFAGHALGLGDLIGGQFALNHQLRFPRLIANCDELDLSQYG